MSAKTATASQGHPPTVGARKQIDLALQGGGSHGAFTWGVLDRILEDERIEIAGVSGTSAGAMNAVALAAGLMDGGRAGARAMLHRFWQRVAQASPFSSLQTGPFGALFGHDNPWLTPLHLYTEWVGRMYSPYQLNPLNLNPLRDILEAVVDFERVRQCDKTTLFISTTHVRSGHLRVFHQAELSADIVLASACLPLLFQAVEIEGEAYWDGGYAGNPSLLPLIMESSADDLLLVQINPQLRESVPVSARDILDRINEVTFNASLVKEMRALGLLKRVIADEHRPGQAYTHPVFERMDRLRLHRIDAPDQLGLFGASSKLNTSWAFMQRLHAIGREAAGRWLDAHFDDLGSRSSVDWITDFPGMYAAVRP